MNKARNYNIENEFWEIKTNINLDLEEIEKFKNNHIYKNINYNQNQFVYLKMNEYQINQYEISILDENKNVIFNSPIKYWITKKKINKMIRILIIIGILEFKIIPNKKIKKDDLTKCIYILNTSNNLDFLFKNSYLNFKKRCEEDDFFEFFSGEKKGYNSFIKNNFYENLNNRNENWEIKNISFNESAKIIDEPNINLKRKYQNLDNRILIKDYLNKSSEKFNKSIGQEKFILKKRKYIENIKNNHVYSELININIFLEKKYKFWIPLIQRSYVWGENKISNLDKMMEELFQNNSHSNSKIFYLNNIVLKKTKIENEYEFYHILDGQQRITSLSLILCSLWNFIFEILDKDEKFLSKNYYFNLLNKIKKMNFFFDKKIIDFNKILNKKNDYKYSNLFNKILKKIEEHLDKYSNIEKIKFLEQILKKILFKTTFSITIIREKDNSIDQNRLFESLNTIFVNLDELDLFKIVLMKNIKNLINENKKNLDEETKINNLWKEHIEDKFYEKNKRDVTFISTFYEYVKNNYFINEKNNVDYHEYKMEIWENYVSKYLNFNLENCKSIQNFEEKLKIISYEIKFVKSFIKTLDEKDISNSNLFYIQDFLYSFKGRKVYIPLVKKIISIIWENGENHFQNFSIDKKNKILEKINETRKWLFEIEKCEVYFQLNLYRGQSLTNIINSIASKIDNLGKFEKFKEIIRSKIMNISNNNQKYNILWSELGKDYKDGFNINLKTKKILLNRIVNSELIEKYYDDYNFINCPSIEHIMPQDFQISKNNYIIENKWNFEKDKNDSFINIENYSNVKESIKKEIHELYLNNIGNLIILDKDINSKIKNHSSFFKKKNVYIEYFNRDFKLDFKELISNSKKWSNDEIIERSNRIMEKIIEIYKDN
ncbi:MAG: hypothetical protein HPPSJP_3470 [Candidatus Hepatoplasma scabrum]|nr:MAG: hypothetical protein HPPSJP_3470 [Candidatus Hepatoplasma sp.]